MTEGLATVILSLYFPSVLNEARLKQAELPFLATPALSKPVFECHEPQGVMLANMKNQNLFR